MLDQELLDLEAGRALVLDKGSWDLIVNEDSWGTLDGDFGMGL